MPLVDLIAGARPNFVKISPIIRAIQQAQTRGSDIRFRLIHTGQHYDKKMSGGFFEQLGIPDPDFNLECGGGSHAEQTASIMVRYEKVLLEKGLPALTLVVGDVTSTMACAITAQKLGVPVAHVEAGIRSGDWSMPEEINRLVTDSISNFFFTTSEVANATLRRSGVAEERIFFVGNTMIDPLVHNLPRLRPPPCWGELGLVSANFFVITLHRPANVDAGQKLKELLDTIATSTHGLPVIFPVHPRTANVLRELGGLWPTLHFIDPLGYLEFNYLVRHAKAVITDSGGITEETTFLKVPCLTLRDNTERPETVTMGTNELIGTNPAKIPVYLERLFAGNWKQGSVPPLWDGGASERIVLELERLFKGFAT